MALQQPKIYDYLNISEEKRQEFKNIEMQSATKLLVSDLVDVTEHENIEEVDLKKVWPYKKQLNRFEIDKLYSLNTKK